MKLKLSILFVVGSILTSVSQDNPPVASNAAPATDATTAPAPSNSAEAVVAPATPATEAAPAPVTAATSPTNSIIPLIQFVDVPLTAAIENLARQAALNYILDPKMTYGQPGPDGRVMVQPNISIRWENLTAEQALYAVLNNYDLQLVDDPRTKIARIAPKDPAAPDPLVTKVIQLKYTSPSNILNSVQSALIDRRSRVVPDVRTSQLVVIATEKEMNSLEELVMRLDTPTKQVLIEARLLEVTQNPTTAKGIDWTGTLAAQNFRAGNNSLPGTPFVAQSVLPGGGGAIVPAQPATIGGLLGGGPGMLMQAGPGAGALFNPALAFMNADGVSAVLSFLNAYSDTRVIATPRAVTLDNEMALLSVTRASPIINVTAGTANTTGGSSISYTNLGTILQVTPRISANNFITLNIVPEVSSIGGTVRRVVGGQLFEVDEYDVRKIQTQVLIPSGNTLVMGGLMSEDSRKGYSKVPILGDIPFAGLAFRHQTKAQLQRNLIIFVTPTIVKDTDYQLSETSFMQSPPPTEDLRRPLSFWNSGKPIDWSKPLRRKSEQ